MKLTVFTPTYNRASTLPALYHSLCRQRSGDFQWLIVDDGSNDDTGALIQSWISEGRLAIQYHRTANQGKMLAHNLGVQLADTPYFLCVDSDDYLTDAALALLTPYLDQIEADPSAAGLILPRSMVNHASQPVSYTDRYTTLSGLYRDGYRGETAIVFKRAILADYPFAVEPGEAFVPEASVYDLLDTKYRYLFVNHPIVVCEYRADGYSRNEERIVRSNPRGFANYWRQRAMLRHCAHDMHLSYSFTCYIRGRAARRRFRKVKGYSLCNALMGTARYCAHRSLYALRRCLCARKTEV